jgi:hypothetical protein
MAIRTMKDGMYMALDSGNQELPCQDCQQNVTVPMVATSLARNVRCLPCFKEHVIAQAMPSGEDALFHLCSEVLASRQEIESLNKRLERLKDAEEKLREDEEREWYEAMGGNV